MFCVQQLPLRIRLVGHGLASECRHEGRTILIGFKLIPSESVLIVPLSLPEPHLLTRQGSLLAQLGSPEGLIQVGQLEPQGLFLVSCPDTAGELQPLQEVLSTALQLLTDQSRFLTRNIPSGALLDTSQCALEGA